MYPGTRLLNILPQLIEILASSADRHVYSVAADLIPRTGTASRTAVPVMIAGMLTFDEWLASQYEYSIGEIGWIFKGSPPALDDLLSELQQTIDADSRAIAQRELWLPRLATFVDESNPTVIPITGEEVLQSLTLERAAIAQKTYDHIRYNARDLPPEALALNKSLHELTMHINRRRRLQAVVDHLNHHRQTGWQDTEQIYAVMGEFLKLNPTVKNVRLFGSRNGTAYRRISDLDLAVVLHAPDEKRGNGDLQGKQQDMAAMVF